LDATSYCVQTNHGAYSQALGSEIG
jgi:hypothetical protein